MTWTQDIVIALVRPSRSVAIFTNSAAFSYVPSELRQADSDTGLKPYRLKLAWQSLSEVTLNLSSL